MLESVTDTARSLSFSQWITSRVNALKALPPGSASSKAFPVKVTFESTLAARLTGSHAASDALYEPELLLIRRAIRRGFLEAFVAAIPKNVEHWTFREKLNFLTFGEKRASDDSSQWSDAASQSSKLCFGYIPTPFSNHCDLSETGPIDSITTERVLRFFEREVEHSNSFEEYPVSAIWLSDSVARRKMRDWYLAFHKRWQAADKRDRSRIRDLIDQLFRKICVQVSIASHFRLKHQYFCIDRHIEAALFDQNYRQALAASGIIIVSPDELIKLIVMKRRTASVRRRAHRLAQSIFSVLN